VLVVQLARLVVALVVLAVQVPLTLSQLWAVEAETSLLLALQRSVLLVALVVPRQVVIGTSLGHQVEVAGAMQDFAYRVRVAAMAVGSVEHRLAMVSLRQVPLAVSTVAVEAVQQYRLLVQRLRVALVAVASLSYTAGGK
jgi:hypothetical protein